MWIDFNAAFIQGCNRSSGNETLPTVVHLDAPDPQLCSGYIAQIIYFLQRTLSYFLFLSGLHAETM